MERLTYDFCIGNTHCWQVKGADNSLCKDVCREQGDNGCDECPIKKAFDRLAAYEDTMTIERAKELAQAEKDGRLMVLPSKDYCWRIRGDIFLDIIRANCRAAHEEAESALKKREEVDNEAD